MKTMYWNGFVTQRKAFLSFKWVAKRSDPEISHTKARGREFQYIPKPMFFFSDSQRIIRGKAFTHAAIRSISLRAFVPSREIFSRITHSCFKRPQRKLSAALLVAFIVTATGCAVGPDFQRPEAPHATGYTPTPLPETTASVPGIAGSAQTFDTTRDIPAQWWSLFKSPQLDALIRKAFEANPDIEAAQAALREVQANVRAQRGFFFPTIQGNYSPSRVKPSENDGGPGIYNLHTAQLTVGFAPDIFGGNRRHVESLQAQAEMQRFQLEAVTITLASNIVAAAIQEASIRDQIAAVERIIAFNTRSLDITKGQHHYGEVSRLDVVAQESALAQTKQLLPPLENQLQLTRNLIRVLVGNLPSEDVEETFTLASFHLPEELPLILPSKLVMQRPDIRAAEAQMRVTNAQVGMAIADRFPSFSIEGNWGGNATHFSQMLQPANLLFELIGNLALTLFDGGTLSYQQRAAEQAFRQAAAEYRGVVLAAFQDVADTLHAIHSNAASLKAATEAEHAAKVALELVRAQQELGEIGYLELLSAESAYQEAITDLIQAQAERFGSTAALFQALGGGWWNRDEDSPSNEGEERAP
ncbi:MAG: efflux transporter outer membrane subunit [Burkholderiales bacterium]|jgi:NodT family efflux transporter outer membrane factor (OMF) lipoprotein|nr:efflux transporter outer membrane subunit [Burkholderiales bacterium]